MRLDIEFTYVILEPLVQRLNPLHSLLIFHFLFWIDILEHLLDQYWIEEAFLDMILNIFSLLYKIYELLE
jgi:hypothetical protein